MPADHTISVNFALPMPLFPLDTVALMPQQRLGMHIFEPRYRQMVDHALQGEHQFATATFEGTSWQQQYHGRPPILPAVCVGQIIRHERRVLEFLANAKNAARISFTTHTDIDVGH